MRSSHSSQPQTRLASGLAVATSASDKRMRKDNMTYTFKNTLYHGNGQSPMLSVWANNEDEATRLLFILVSNPNQWRLA